MKRFMILILVLGMAPMAGAEISFVSTSAWVGNSQTVTIQVSSDTSGVAWAGYIGYTHANVSITTMSALPAAGTDAAVTPSPDGYAGYYMLSAADNSLPFDSIQAGIQFEGTIHGTVDTLGSYNFYLYDGSWSTTPVDIFTLFIPEPMTLALLGLGGLGLRKRRAT